MVHGGGPPSSALANGDNSGGLPSLPLWIPTVRRRRRRQRGTGMVMEGGSEEGGEGEGREEGAGLRQRRGSGGEIEADKREHFI